jgi:hypothetical protein
MPGSRRSTLLLAVLASLFWGHAAMAQHEHSSREFEVFVAGEALLGSGQPHPVNDDSWIDADIIFGLTHDQFRVFGEYYVTPEEHEFERLQVGFEFVPETLLWLGRFHQPSSAWNTEHHHGRYLQTAVTRPSIENWEDEQGIIPQHITGALLESRRPIGADAAIQISGGAGAAPALGHVGFDPITIGNNPGKHGVSFTARLAYLPEYAGTSSAGLLYGHDQVYVRQPQQIQALNSRHAVLDVHGAYLDWSSRGWRTIGTLYYVDVALDQGARNQSFISGYLQLERQLDDHFTAFGRVEDSARMQHSSYVELFDEHDGDLDIALRRQALGLRWDYARRQALSAEISHITSLQHSADELRLLWSAAIP